jgi:hypothetical protein
MIKDSKAHFLDLLTKNLQVIVKKQGILKSDCISFRDKGGQKEVGGLCEESVLTMEGIFD